MAKRNVRQPRHHRTKNDFKRAAQTAAQPKVIVKVEREPCCFLNESGTCSKQPQQTTPTPAVKKESLIKDVIKGALLGLGFGFLLNHLDYVVAFRNTPDYVKRDYLIGLMGEAAKTTDGGFGQTFSYNIRELGKALVFILYPVTSPSQKVGKYNLPPDFQKRIPEYMPEGMKPYYKDSHAAVKQKKARQQVRVAQIEEKEGAQPQQDSILLSPQKILEALDTDKARPGTDIKKYYKEGLSYATELSVCWNLLWNIKEWTPEAQKKLKTSTKFLEESFLSLAQHPEYFDSTAGDELTGEITNTVITGLKIGDKQFQKAANNLLVLAVEMRPAMFDGLLKRKMNDLSPDEVGVISDVMQIAERGTRQVEKLKRQRTHAAAVRKNDYNSTMKNWRKYGPQRG